MPGIIFSDHLVQGFLKQPLELQKEWKLAQGQPLDGSEKPAFYTDAEIRLIQKEGDDIYDLLSSGCVATGDWDMSAGAPASGKTEFLNRLVRRLPKSFYGDPDETILKNFRPYLNALKSDEYGPHSRRMGYTKWRAASNYLVHALMNRASQQGLNITYGTTATSPAIGIVYKAAQDAGYNVHTHIIAAPEDVRLQSAALRHEHDQSRVVTPKDLIEKAELFYVRLPEYFDRSNRLSVYWRDQVLAGPELVASGQDGQFHIHNNQKHLALDLHLREHGVQFGLDELAKRYTSRFIPQRSP